MNCPLVGERVWVSGCRDEFVVARTDYATCLASLTAKSDGVVREDVPFVLLFAHCDVGEPARDTALPERVREVLESSDHYLREVGFLIRDLRETVSTSNDTIRQSRALILESDKTIARWQGWFQTN